MTTFIGFSAVPVPSFSRQSSRIISPHVVEVVGVGGAGALGS